MKLKLIPILAIVILTNCGTNLKIESVVDRSNTAKLKDIAVIASTPIEYWTKRTTNLLTTKLNENKINFVFYSEPLKKQKLSLTPEKEEDPIKEFLEKSGKQFVFIINIRKMRTVDGGADSFESEGIVVDLKNKSTIWRFNISGEKKLFGRPIEDFVDGLFGQLKNDGLI